MNKKEQNSVVDLLQKKETVISLGELAAKIGLSFVPGGSIFYDLTKLITLLEESYLSERRNKRIKCFHEELLASMPDTKFEEYKDKPFNLDDYSSLLNNVIQDEEESKLIFYSRFFKSLLDGFIPKHFKIQLIKSLRNLSSHDIALMKTIFVKTYFDYDKKSTPAKIKSFLKETDDPLHNISRENLKRFGFLHEVEADKFAPSELLNLLILAIYNNLELTPHSIRPEIPYLKGTIVFNDNNDLDQYVRKILDKLHSKNIDFLNGRFNRINFVARTNHIFLVCYNGKELPNNFKNLDRFKSNYKIIILLTSSNADANNFPFNVSDVADLSKETDKEIDALVQTIDNFVTSNEKKHLDNYLESLNKARNTDKDK